LNDRILGTLTKANTKRVACISICIAVIIAMIAIGIQRPDAFDTYLVTPSSKTSIATGAASVSCIVIACTSPAKQIMHRLITC